MIFFITQAFADGAVAKSSTGSIFNQLLPIILFIGVMYFVLIRPNQKRQKQHQALVSAMKKGDKVLTNSGILGTITKVINDKEVMIEIADGVVCKFVKSAVVSLINQEIVAPVANDNKKEDSK